MSRVTPGAPGNFTTTPSGTQDMNLVSVSSTSITLGQKTMSASFPVVIASNQTAVPVSGTVSVSGSVSATQSGTWDIGTITNPVTVTATNLDIHDLSSATDSVSAVQSGSWSVTANAGTNLNTSTLALESGGNLAAIKAKTDNIPALGQALAAASVPVVLTAAQLTTLTPLSTVAVTQSTSPWVVSGTVAATQSGTWTVQPGNTANTTPWLVAINDGTTTGSIIAGDTGQNSQVIVGARKEVSFTTTTVQAVATTDVSNYRWVSVHITSQGTNSTVTFQGSNDNTNWINVALQNTNATSQPTSTSATGVALLQGSLGFRYFRLNVTGISAGTTAGVVEFFATAGELTTLGVNADTELPSAAALSDTTANPTTPMIGAALMSWDGTQWLRAKGDLNGGLVIRPFQSSAADADGTSNTAASIQSSTGNPIYDRVTLHLYNGTTWDRVRSGGVTGMLGVSGDTAHDAADAGNPVKVGYRAISTNPTRVADADRAGGVSDLAGRQIVNLGHVRELRGKQTTTISASTAETTIVTAGGSGVFNDVVAIIVSNTAAATNTRIDFRDATGGSVLFSLFCPAAQTTGFTLPGYSIPQTTANNNWTAQCGTSTTDVRVLVIFEKNT